MFKRRKRMVCLALIASCCALASSSLLAKPIKVNATEDSYMVKIPYDLDVTHMPWNNIWLSIACSYSLDEQEKSVRASVELYRSEAISNHLKGLLPLSGSDGTVPGNAENIRLNISLGGGDNLIPSKAISSKKRDDGKFDYSPCALLTNAVGGSYSYGNVPVYGFPTSANVDKDNAYNVLDCLYECADTDNGYKAINDFKTNYYDKLSDKTSFDNTVIKTVEVKGEQVSVTCKNKMDVMTNMNATYGSPAALVNARSTSNSVLMTTIVAATAIVASGAAIVLIGTKKRKKAE